MWAVNRDRRVRISAKNAQPMHPLVHDKAPRTWPGLWDRENFALIIVFVVTNRLVAFLLLLAVLLVFISKNRKLHSTFRSKFTLKNYICNLHSKFTFKSCIQNLHKIYTYTYSFFISFLAIFIKGPTKLLKT